MITPLFTSWPARRTRRAFTLVEMLVVMTIILLMVGLGASAFKGGSATDGVKGASLVAAGEFDLARNEAIMRQTSSRVIVDTAYARGGAIWPIIICARMTVAYLNPQGVDVNGTLATTSGLPVDPVYHPTNWVQSGAWIVLPGNTYFDINYSVLHGTGITINFAGPNAPTSGYAYYQFDPTGQTPPQTASATFFIVTPTGSTPATTTLAQCVISSGMVNPATGTFQERAQQAAGVTTAPGTCYGFVLFRMGHTTFFLDNSEIQQPS